MPHAVNCDLVTGLAWAGSMVVLFDTDRDLDATREVLMYLPKAWPGQARALVWVIYSQIYHHKHKATGYVLDVLPVTQVILKIREDIVEGLRLLTDLEAS